MRSIERALYLPKEWASASRERRRAAGVPGEIAFATRPELARALAAGARPAWVVADAVYGSDSKLCAFSCRRPSSPTCWRSRGHRPSA